MKTIEPTAFIYDTDAVSEKQFNEHLTIYKGYFPRLAGADADLAEGVKEIAPGAQSKDQMYRGLKSCETFCLSSVILHELYFDNMTRRKTAPSAETIGVLTECFGGLEGFLTKFAECALAARGWALFAYEQRSGTYRVFMQDAHDEGVVPASYPILALDMYEHAYFTDYASDKKKYAEAFIKSINWDSVNTRIGILNH